MAKAVLWLQARAGLSPARLTNGPYSEVYSVRVTSLSVPSALRLDTVMLCGAILTGWPSRR